MNMKFMLAIGMASLISSAGFAADKSADKIDVTAEVASGTAAFSELNSATTEAQKLPDKIVKNSVLKSDASSFANKGEAANAVAAMHPGNPDVRIDMDAEVYLDYTKISKALKSLEAKENMSVNDSAKQSSSAWRKYMGIRAKNMLKARDESQFSVAYTNAMFRVGNKGYMAEATRLNTRIDGVNQTASMALSMSKDNQNVLANRIVAEYDWPKRIELTFSGENATIFMQNVIGQTIPENMRTFKHYKFGNNVFVDAQPIATKDGARYVIKQKQDGTMYGERVAIIPGARIVDMATGENVPNTKDQLQKVGANEKRSKENAIGIEELNSRADLIETKNLEQDESIGKAKEAAAAAQSTADSAYSAANTPVNIVEVGGNFFHNGKFVDARTVNSGCASGNCGQ